MLHKSVFQVKQAGSVESARVILSDLDLRRWLSNVCCTCLGKRYWKENKIEWHDFIDLSIA